jgi:hypothetical protein
MNLLLIRPPPDGKQRPLQRFPGRRPECSRSVLGSRFVNGPTRRRTACALALGSSLGLPACGGPDHENRERPPASITVTAAIGEERIRVSPRRFGAGPIRLVISNQTASAQELTFETTGDEAGLTETTAPINPSGTATLELDVTQGAYSMMTADDGVRPAAVSVGAPRESAQNELMLP